LRHYHQIGLLTPSGRTESGHRLYTEDDVARLHQILSLRQLGLPLKEIRSLMESPDDHPLLVVQVQLEIVNERIKLYEKLRDELEQLKTLLQYHQKISVERLMQIMELIRMNERRYLTPELVEKLKTLQSNLAEETKSGLKTHLLRIDEAQRQNLRKMIFKERE
jgi:DNA-binding transcriptional MerR regulator